MQVNSLLSSTSSTLPPSPVAPVLGQQSDHAPTQTTQAVSSVDKAQTEKQATLSKEQKQAHDKALDSAVKQLNDTAQLFNTQLQFSIDPTTGRRVVQVTDSQTNQVIRQIPSEDALRISQAIGDFKGLLVKDQA